VFHLLSSLCITSYFAVYRRASQAAGRGPEQRTTARRGTRHFMSLKEREISRALFFFFFYVVYVMHSDSDSHF
jgi:hypothetical protein